MVKLAEEYNNNGAIAHGEAWARMLHHSGFYERALDVIAIKHGLSYVENFLKLIDNILNS